MGLWASIAVNTVVLGGTYAVIGIGFVIIFRTTRVVSFIQGAFMAVGALFFAYLLNNGVPTAAAFATAMVATAALGVIIYRLFFMRVAGAEPFTASIATIGLGTLVLAGATLIWGSAQIVIRQVVSFHDYHLGGGLYINGVGIFTIAAMAVVYAVVIAGLRATPTGQRMLAVADNTTLAFYTGIRVTGISALAWAVAAATAGVAGMTYVIGSQPDPPTIEALGILAFPAILLGGLNSIWGALLGSFIVALAQTATATYLGSQWQDAIAYFLLVAVMVIRPQGLFGQVEVDRL
jgi:branched-chain amino acid transport system permease protein